MSRISPEKSNFARTCNLLSHYLKEKGSPRDLNLGINGKVETFSEATAAKTTVDFFSEKPSRISTQIVKPLNLFPQCISEEAETEPKHAQMTIFYGGQVLVFHEFSADKAKELMELATKAVTPNITIGNCVDSTSSASNIGSISQSVRPQDRFRLQSDLPLARTTSLHRFLSKRKERASARSPYQLHNPSADSRKQQFDLNF